jgi:hypothetical protein
MNFFINLFMADPILCFIFNELIVCIAKNSDPAYLLSNWRNLRLVCKRFRMLLSNNLIPTYKGRDNYYDDAEFIKGTLLRHGLCVRNGLEVIERDKYVFGLRHGPSLAQFGKSDEKVIIETMYVGGNAIVKF